MASQQTQHDLTGLVSFTDTVSDAFRQGVVDTLNAMPAGVIDLLKQEGWKFEFGSRFLEVAPQMANRHPPGRPRGVTYDSVGGMSNPHIKTLYTAENIFHPWEGQWQKNERALGDLRHEIGHAIDAALGRPSEKAAFRKAHRADVQAMNDQTLDDFSYYTGTKDTRGPHEAFAETFAAAFGGGCHGTEVAEVMPGAAGVTKRIVENFKANRPPLQGVVKTIGETCDELMHGVTHMLDGWRHKSARQQGQTASNDAGTVQEKRQIPGQRM